VIKINQQMMRRRRLALNAKAASRQVDDKVIESLIARSDRSDRSVRVGLEVVGRMTMMKPVITTSTAWLDNRKLLQINLPSTKCIQVNEACDIGLGNGRNCESSQLFRRKCLESKYCM
jgi:hypothetical protein